MSEETVHESEEKRSRNGIATFFRRIARRLGRGEKVPVTDADTSKATFQLYEDDAGEHRWRLRHDNGNIIADGGHGYSSKQKAKQGLQSVKTNAPAAAVDGSPDAASA
jgi:uncharacterized protein YegP (UPF0339 family)